MNKFWAILLFGLLVGAANGRGAPQGETELSAADLKAMRLILSEPERKEFDRLKTLEARRAWARIYWKRRDPTPTTDRNERFEEFRRRLEYVRKWFHAPGELGFDDRGVIYLRYGEPTEKYVQPAGELHVRANESWAYSEISSGLVFDFVSRGAYYRLVDDLTQAISARTEPAVEMANLIELYSNRAYLDPKYDRIATELRRILSVDMSDYGPGSDPRNFNIGNINLARSELGDMISDLQKIRAEAPKVVYRHDFKKKPLAIAHSLARFRAGNGRIRVEVYYGIPYNHLKFEPAGRYLRTPLRCTIAVFDSNYVRVATDSVNTDLVALSARAAARGAYISQFNFELPPGDYHLALRAENAPANRLGILRADFRCPRFPEDELAMSDLEPSPQIVMPYRRAGADTVGDRFQRFTKHGLRVMPLPGLTIDKARTLYVYFEIYNLRRGANGRTRYDLEYALSERGKGKSLLGKFLGGKKPVLSVTETREGDDPNPVEHIGVDLRRQPDGKYDLRIRVVDRNTGKAVQASVPIRIVSRARQ